MNYLLHKHVVKMDDVRELYLCTRLYVSGDRNDVIKRVYLVIDMIVDEICERIIRDPSLLTHENTEDLWSYMEDEVMVCHACDCTSLIIDTIEEREFRSNTLSPVL